MKIAVQYAMVEVNGVWVRKLVPSDPKLNQIPILIEERT